MKRHPHQGVRGAKPRLKAKAVPPSGNGEPTDAELSRQYLLERNVAMHTKNLRSQMELALQREQLIEKSLVNRQAAFLFVAMRQKVLSVPRTLARRCANRSAAELLPLLTDAMHEVLREIKDLPKVGIDPNWESEEEG